jgi:hypothetical protein
VGKHQRKGPVYDQSEVAKTTVRETTENNRHHGFLGKHELKGPVYDQTEAAKTTIRETTENNRHHGFLGKHKLNGPVYDRSEVAKTTVRETTEDNRHHGFVNDSSNRRGPVYDRSEVAKTTVRETTENNRHHGFVGKTKIQGPVYDKSQTAKVTIRETTEDNRYITGVGRSTLQNGGGYQTTKWEAKNPQKAYLCDREYVGTGGATTNKKPRTYKSEYQVNTNKEKIAVGRSPNEVKNSIAIGKEGYNICINKLDLDREVPHVLGKNTSVNNVFNPEGVGISRCNLTTRKNVTPSQVDRLQVDTLDHVKCNPLRVNQNIN